MKDNILNKEANYSLSSSDNYKKVLDCDVNDATKKYSQLITEYYKFIIDNLKLTNIGFSNFIIIRGLDTITNVFFHLLYHTKNINLTYFHCQKSFYFYIEFVGQMSDSEKTFLQLTSRDATTYVYKKTIYELKNELSNINTDVELKTKLDLIQLNMNICQTYLLKIVNSPNKDSSLTECIIELNDKLNLFHSNSTKSVLDKVIDTLYYKIDNIVVFFEINAKLFKKIVKTPGLLYNVEKNCKHVEFDLHLNETADIIVNWLLATPHD